MSRATRALSPARRDAGLRRLRYFNRFLIGATVAATGVLADVAAGAFPAHKRSLTSTNASLRSPRPARASRARHHRAHHHRRAHRALSPPAQTPTSSSATTSAAPPATTPAPQATTPAPQAPAPAPAPAPVVSGGS